MAQKLLQERGRSVFRWIVQRQLKRMGHISTLPHGTPMLTQKQKDARVQWAKQHKDDDWSRTIFTDETSYQLFRNTIRRRSKNSKREKSQFRRTDRRFWYGELLVSRVLWVTMRSNVSWRVLTTFVFLKIISLPMPENSLLDAGDCNRTMIPSTEVVSRKIF